MPTPSGPPAPTAPPPLPAAPLIADVESFLQAAIADLAPVLDPPTAGPGAPRILPSFCLWAGLLVCVLRGFSRQRDLWRLLTARGLWAYPRLPLSDDAVYARLAAAPPTTLAPVFAHVRDLLAPRLAPFLPVPATLVPWAPDIVALDEAHLDPVARLLPALRPLPPRAPALLPGKFAGVFSIRRQQWQHLEFIADPRQNERVAAPALVAQVAPGSLIVADLAYFGFAWFDQLTAAGYSWVSRLRGRTSTVVLHSYYDTPTVRDQVVWLGAYRADRAGTAVRLVEVAQGGRWQAYVTNELEPARLSVADVVEVYGRRWDIELAVKLVKQELGLGLLWAAKPGVIQHQMWAVLIIAQILQALRLEIAGRAGVDAYEVSMALLVRWGPEFARQGLDPVTVFVEQGRALKFVRPASRRGREAPAVVVADYRALPKGTELTRTARHGGRRSQGRPGRGAAPPQALRMAAAAAPAPDD
jgi:hypothetical protein